jgi:hypothetical protein
MHAGREQRLAVAPYLDWTGMPSVDVSELVTRRSWVTGFFLHCSRETIYQDQKQLSAREAM